MDDKNKMVDFPNYDPDRRVPFPPSKDDKSPFGKAPQRKPEDAPEKAPFHQNYDPDPSTPDPSQTSPGGPNLRDPATRLPEGTDLSKLSPDVDLKE